MLKSKLKKQKTSKPTFGQTTVVAENPYQLHHWYSVRTQANTKACTDIIQISRVHLNKKARREQRGAVSKTTE